jgi:hypothetical protein
MPALASLVMGPRGTILAAVGALAVTALTAALHHTWGGVVYSNLLAALLVSIASVTMSSLMRTRRQTEFDQVRRIAAATQRVLLRPVPAQVGPVRMACMYSRTGTDCDEVPVWWRRCSGVSGWINSMSGGKPRGDAYVSPRFGHRCQSG